MVELLTTHHSPYAVVALYNQYQEVLTRVAGPGPTILGLVYAVVALYNQYHEVLTRVAGPGPTILGLVYAVVALYNQYHEVLTRVAGPGPTILGLICAAMGGCVEMLNSLQSQYITIISKLCPHIYKTVYFVYELVRNLTCA